MASLLERLWYTSLATLAVRIQRWSHRFRESEEWLMVKAGPAAGVELRLPVPLKDWALEMVNGSYDRFLYDAIENHRHKKFSGVRCWDIGSHVGYHALAFAAQGAQVVAFEPCAANAARFRQHLERNTEFAPRIRLMPMAVADCDGVMEFVESGDMRGRSAGSHLAEATTPHQTYADFKHLNVFTVTIDTLIQKQGEPPPDIIKLDVEGAEHLVVNGGRVSLARHKPLLIVEVHHICAMFSLVPLLLELGYSLEILDREHATPSRCFIAAF